MLVATSGRVCTETAVTEEQTWPSEAAEPEWGKLVRILCLPCLSLIEHKLPRLPCKCKKKVTVLVAPIWRLVHPFLEQRGARGQYRQPSYMHWSYSSSARGGGSVWPTLVCYVSVCAISFVCPVRNNLCCFPRAQLGEKTPGTHARCTQ